MPTRIKGTNNKTYVLDDSGNILSVEDTPAFSTGAVGKKRSFPKTQQEADEIFKREGIVAKSPFSLLFDLENTEAFPTGPLATGIGGLLGEALASRIPLGGPIVRALMRTAGGLGGGAIGSGIGSLLDKSDVSPLGESALNQVLSEGIRGVSFLAPRLRHPIQGMREAATRRFLKPNVTPEMEVAIAATPEIELSPAQLAGRVKVDIAHALAPEAAQELVTSQQTGVNQVINRILTNIRGTPVTTSTRGELGTFAKESQKKAKAQLQSERTVSSKAWDELIEVELPKNKAIIEEIDPDTSKWKKISLPDGGDTFIPAMIKKEIQGPIDVSGTRIAFKPTFDKINKMFGAIETGANPLVLNSVKGLRSVLNNLFEGQPLRQYEDLKRLRTSIRGMVEDIPSGYKNEVEGIFSALRSHLRDDIEKSLSSDLWKNSPNAPALLDRARTLSQSMKEAFNDEIKGAIKGYPTQFFNTMMAAPEKVREFNRIITGSNIVKDPRVSEYFFMKHLNDFTERGVEIPFFKSKEALHAWRDSRYQELVREAIPSNIRTQIENMLLTSTRVDPRLSNTGVVAVGIREAGLGLNVVGGLAGSLIAGTGALISGQELPTILKSSVIGGTAGLTFLIAAKDFAKNVMLNPKMLPTVRTLMTAPPSSTHAKKLSVDLFKMMKGAQIWLQTQNGPIEGRINKEGKFEELSQ